MNEPVFAAVNAALAAGEPVALVTIVRAAGSTPQRVGAKMVVYADGRMLGTIGGGCYEADAFGKAREALRDRKPRLLHYELNDDLAQETGLVCGGQMDVYVEPIEPAPHLYVVGAGHVGFHLARLAASAGFRVHVLDDREKFANRDRFPEADEVATDSIPEWLERTRLTPASYVVVVTRGHRYDLDALRALVRRELRYVGLVGSRAKTARMFEALRSEGVSTEALRRVHAPVGLDIGAVTPEEIAVSIVAELIAVRYGRIRYSDEDREPDVRSLRWTPRALAGS
jgi:xanthine dehydrogenase accessory factor